MNLFYFLILVGILVLIHEYGHYLFARLHKVGVIEFSIGFGPSILSFEKNKTKFSIRLLPFGGYVKLAGLDTEETVDDESSFHRKSWLARFSILASGGIMNFLLAIFILSLLFTWGFPTVIPTGINSVLSGSPAELAGIKPGDKIISINGKLVSTAQDITQAIQSSEDKVILVIEREGNRLTFEIMPRYDAEQNKKLIGITVPSFTEIKYSIFNALKIAFGTFSAIILGTLDALWKLITGRLGTESFSGPIGVARMTGAAAQMGIKVFLQLMAFLSIQWGLFNLLPIPALDGGRILFLILNLWKRVKISPERENFIHYIGFIILLVLMIIVTIGDVRKF